MHHPQLLRRYSACALIGAAAIANANSAHASAVTPTLVAAQNNASGNKMGASPQMLAVDFDQATSTKCSGIPEQLTSGGTNYPSDKIITTSQGGDLVWEWFTGSGTTKDTQVNASTGNPALYELTINLWNITDAVDPILGLDATNHLWESTYSDGGVGGCVSVTAADWGWSKTTTTGMAIASPAPGYGASLSSMGLTWIIGSDQDNVCNTNGDSYVNVIHSSVWYQQSSTNSTTLCSRFVQADYSDHWYTLMNEDVWGFTPGATNTTSTPLSSTPVPAYTDSFAVAGDNSGFAVTTAAGGMGSHLGTKGSDLYVGNLGETGTMANVQFLTTFDCYSTAIGGVGMDNIVFDQLHQNLYFTCYSQNDTQYNTYMLTAAQIKTGTGVTL
jgi:hypothetical protein